jgi:hypothetical protein
LEAGWFSTLGSTNLSASNGSRLKAEQRAVPSLFGFTPGTGTGKAVKHFPVANKTRRLPVASASSHARRYGGNIKALVLTQMDELDPLFLIKEQFS